VYENGKYNHFLMLNKFWNINQVPETLLHEIKDKKIKSVYNKEDGTLVTFIKVNGKIVSKTKMGFDNEQTIEVDKIVKNNKNILKFVDDCFNKDLVTMWEYTSFKNRIVLEYNTSELTLLKVRNNKTGEYVDVEQFRGLGFNVVESLEFTDLESLMKRIEDATKIEGCVITFEDDQMVKWKAKEYCELHHMIDDLNREDYVISLILNEMIDDFLSKLNKNSDYEKVKWIENIELKIRKYITQRTKDVDELVSKYNGSMKDFALSYLKDKNFALAAKVIKGDSTYDTVKKWILLETSKLGKARELLKNINL
jgi:RNA ligase